jgi:hypothetical protein
VIWHAPALQVTPDTLPLQLQFIPQPPQLVVVFVSTSHPLAGFWSQSAKPGLQPVIWHIPAEQEKLEAFVPEHTIPQPPQLFGSPNVLTHVAPQTVCPAGQSVVLVVVVVVLVVVVVGAAVVAVVVLVVVVVGAAVVAVVVVICAVVVDVVRLVGGIVEVDVVVV